MEHLATLRKVPLFEGLPQDVLYQLARLVRRRTFKEGDLLIAKGETGRTLFILLKGKVAVVDVDEEAREVVLDILKEGDVFGELSLIDGQGRSADIQALTDGEALMILHADLLPLVQRQPQLAWSLLQTLAQRLRGANDLILKIAWLNAQQRVAWVLLKYASEGRVPKWLTPANIAKRVGLTRETASRILGQWQREKIIWKDENGALVVRPDRLQRILRQSQPVEPDRSFVS
ncbi:MAG: Crp/Fnr family transcriptional regulator [Armatimonadetes bacterium]|nr:Crp/Fnr family transcriptional regulator [Armatimonadota bacterium]MDW8122686.1 Crp/Fnr family transcriptional regulator [Armatimonadota bacterium]